MSPPRFLFLMALGGLGSNTWAADHWLELGDFMHWESRAKGRLSINLATLHPRSQHLEIWDRINFTDIRHQPFLLPGESRSEVRTLWALHCRTGEIAKVTSSNSDDFEPRSSHLKYYVPPPNSIAANVLVASCEVAAQKTAESKAQLQSRPDTIEVLFNDDALDESD